jgi:hypothetical protein
MYCLDGNDEFNQIHHEDLWVYNKLQLSRSLGYVCGPVGTTVPKPDFYIVRPSINFLGMGRFARIEWIENHTDRFHPGEFWCEIFKGEHLSVDFKDKKSKLVVRGTKNQNSPMYKWEKWEKIDRNIEFPHILSQLTGNYEWINCEFINNHLIEVHFRQNPDFRYGNSIAIPVWYDDDPNKSENLSYIEDSDYYRRGFYIK